MAKRVALSAGPPRKLARSVFKRRNCSCGGWNERTNLHVVESICDLLDDMSPRPAGSRRGLISFVADRPGHDRRYAIDASKLERELGWRADENFESGLAKTVRWFFDNRNWWQTILDRGYQQKRIGLG